jgi:hypothetical protein
MPASFNSTFDAVSRLYAARSHSDRVKRLLVFARRGVMLKG